MNLSKQITIIVLSFLVITGCSSIKKTLSGAKKENSNDLPKPEKAIINDSDKDIDFSGFLSNSKDKKKIIKKKNSELEKSLSKILNSN